MRILFTAIFALIALGGCRSVLGFEEKEYVEPDASGGAGGSPLECGSLTACSDVCADLMNDPGHCGRCGRSCEDGVCSAGLCNPIEICPTESQFVNWLSQSGSDLFFASDCPEDCSPNPHVKTVAKMNGSVRRLATTGGAPTSATLVGGFVYWATIFGKDISRVSFDGGSPQVLATNIEAVNRLAFDAEHIYFTEHRTPGGIVGRLPIIEGGTPTTLVSDQNDGDGIAVDDEFVYWVTQKVPSGVWRANKVDGSGVTLLAGVDLIGGMAIDDGWVYYGNVGDGEVAKVPKAGGEPVVIASGEDRPLFVAVDDDAVYFADSGLITLPGSMHLVRVGKDGKNKLVLSVNDEEHERIFVDWSTVIAVDDTHVFWTGGRKLWRLVK